MNTPNTPNTTSDTSDTNDTNDTNDTTPSPSPTYPVKPVPFISVHLNDLFWSPRIETNRAVTVPFAFQQCETSGRMDIFHRAAAAVKGEPNRDKTLPGYPFDDTDVYKVIEGAAYTLRVHPDPALESYIDELVKLIASAQEPDGYLYPARTIDPEHPHKAAGSERWELERAHSHELYNLGHLYEAAVAYEQATGKRGLLEIALKTADLLDRTFGPGKRSIWPGHQITELALVKLNQSTGDPRYLDLARCMLDHRGPDGSQGSGMEYNQSHLPVTEQSEAVGHSVRATYMYAGMADVAAATGDTTYIAALDRIWADVVGTKLYITGGIGARHEGEAFGDPYELPNLTAYSETCAAIGNVFWNHRLFLLHADARYIDVLERTLYNALLAGVSLDGMSFFYENPLESEGGYVRSPWFGCACCPSNVSRFLPSLPGYAYAAQGSTIYVNLFAAGTTDITLADGRTIKLTQETRYPWDGQVRIKVSTESSDPFTIKIRIPGWARNEVVPGDLYSFIDSSNEPVIIKINRQPFAPVKHTDRGYVTISRQWHSGDVIAINLPMPIRRIAANEKVEADRGKVAIQRGPLVYCLESPDNPNISVRDLVLADDAQLAAEFAPDKLGGIVAIKASQSNMQKHSFTAIPYYAWANRGSAEMAVWLKREQ